MLNIRITDVQGKTYLVNLEQVNHMEFIDTGIVFKFANDFLSIELSPEQFAKVKDYFETYLGGKTAF